MSLAHAIAALPLGLQHSIALYANPTMNVDLAAELNSRMREGEETCDRILTWMPGATLDDGVLCYEWEENEETTENVWRPYTMAGLMYACVALRRRGYSVDLEPGNATQIGNVIIDDLEMPRLVIYEDGDCRFSPMRWGVTTWWEDEYNTRIIG